MELKSDDRNTCVSNGRFNFRGKRETGNLVLWNWKIGEVHDFTLNLESVSVFPPLNGREYRALADARFEYEEEK